MINFDLLNIDFVMLIAILFLNTQWLKYKIALSRQTY
jgi:hypothetical protein